MDSKRPPAATPFLTTRWSVVAAAGKPDTPTARAALSELCSTYWYPLYAYVRRRGHSQDDAQDLTQAFFARLLEKNVVLAADPTRGRFRAFLLGSLKNFLANEWDREHAQKRGGGATPLSLDFEFADERFAAELGNVYLHDRLGRRIAARRRRADDRRARRPRRGHARLARRSARLPRHRDVRGHGARARRRGRTRVREFSSDGYGRAARVVGNRRPHRDRGPAARDRRNRNVHRPRRRRVCVHDRLGRRIACDGRRRSPRRDIRRRPQSHESLGRRHGQPNSPSQRRQRAQRAPGFGHERHGDRVVRESADRHDPNPEVLESRRANRGPLRRAVDSRAADRHAQRRVSDDRRQNAVRRRGADR
ncbi:MAG: hypothetical protein HUU28_07100, partial [Planctomycetaceae bacterium]|nr:hypothetical protein [Planctomycetaceae bacterium]